MATPSSAIRIRRWPRTIACCCCPPTSAASSEPMPFGYHGCYLRIDVSRGVAERVPLADSLLREYIGGSGLGTRLLLDEGGATADPLSPDAPLVFPFSP